MQDIRRRPLSPAFVLIIGALVPASLLADLVVGTSGPDVLEGTPEADTLDGKGGADTMMGLGGDDTYVVNQVDDVVIEGAGEGIDTIRSLVTYELPIFVENLVLTGIAASNGKGNNLGNRLTGNNARNVLNGRGGNDTMIGKDGNDVYIVNAIGDVVTESFAKGIDTVRSSVTYTLRPNVEKLILTGVAAVNGNGNDLHNSITGNSANNILNGKTGRDTLKGRNGNDRLVGGAGNDILEGGLGQDTFVLDSPLDESTNVDEITDFSPLDDLMELEGEVFPALSTAGTLPAAAFLAAPVAGNASHRILYDPATGILRYDADGTGATAPVQFGMLAAGLAVTNEDFEVHDPVASAGNYTTQIQPIFNARCISCHSGAFAPQGLQLDAANSYASLVNVNSNEVPSLKRVLPFDPDSSYLVQKIEGTADVGGRMPLGQQPLTAVQIGRIRMWIAEGAEP